MSKYKNKCNLLHLLMLSPSLFKALIITVCVFGLFSCSDHNQITATDQNIVSNPQNLLYNSPLISYSGRMYDTGYSILTGWCVYSKTPIRFAINNADTLKLKFKVKLRRARANFYVKIDSVLYEEQIFAPDTNNFEMVIPELNKQFHHIEFIMSLGLCSNTEAFDMKETVEFLGAEINNGSFKSSDKMQNKPKICLIADSWGCAMSELFDNSKYNIFNLCASGSTMESIKNLYPWIVYGQPHHDQTMDAYIINIGVNDFFYNISELKFKENLNLLVKIIKNEQPTSKIFLVNKPTNTFTNSNFGYYGGVMKEIVLSYDNVYFLDSDLLNLNQNMWSDSYHLTSSGYQLYTDYIESYLEIFF